MRLPENMSKIIGRTYSGQKDDEGRPHGHGKMEYVTNSSKKYRYEGHFEHGVRSGYGVWYESSQLIKEYEPWEWVQMGEYDSAGRLIHPNTRPGPYREVIDLWDEKFRGWWINDDAVHSLKGRKLYDWDIEFTEDEKFLNFFRNFQAVRMMPEDLISKLKNSKGTYARYAYGVWLWICHKDRTSLMNAFRIFQESAQCGIADALQIMSRMYYIGEAYDNETGRFILDRRLSKELNAEAVEKGSLLARLRRNRDLFENDIESEIDRKAAIAEAEHEASLPDASILWTEQAGWYHDIEGETEKAVKAYEKCIINGYYAPIYDLALIYFSDDDSRYYETLMNLGMQLDIPDCHVLGNEKEDLWESLDEYDRKKLHQQLKANLSHGTDLGSGYCAYHLADYYLNGKMGFGIDLNKGKKYADIAVTFGYNLAFNLVIETAETLQDTEFMSDDDLLKYRIEALRYGVEDQLDYVIKNKDVYIDMGYGDEIESVWLPLWKRNNPHIKTQIDPAAIIIKPTGEVSVVDADIFSMSYREMALLIDAEGLDAIHFSEPLNKLTANCRFRGYKVAMYADKDGYVKRLPDNPVATVLYGGGAEIKGAVIIALEDHRYDTYSFHFQEDIDTLIAEISRMTGDLLRA